MRTIKTGMFVALFSLLVTVPALSANQGICRDGSDPILDVETLERLLRLARQAEASDQLSCDENNYLSYIRRGASKKRLNLLKKTGKGCQLEWASFEGQTFRETSFMKPIWREPISSIQLLNPLISAMPLSEGPNSKKPLLSMGISVQQIFKEQNLTERHLTTSIFLKRISQKRICLEPILAE